MSTVERILITGGAGFIGSHLADELLRRGYRVRVLDNLDPQVHGSQERVPAYLSREVEIFRGDVRDREAVARALAGIDAVFHLASAVGVGQSMYEIERYTDINNRGTAVLLEALIQKPVQKLVVASSMSIYGEGLYRTEDGRLCSPQPRSSDRLKAAQWDLLDEHGSPMAPLPTPESKQAVPESIYALSKFDQERMCLLFGRAYAVPSVALRFFNVYGERQALSNPYTGVLAIFASRYLNGKPPLIFEDGRQRRDFVHVHDLARGCALALATDAARDDVFNLASGSDYSVLEIALRLAKVLGTERILPRVTGHYRAGDIRNCFADLSRARSVLGFHARIDIETGLAGLAEWLARTSCEDRSELAANELRRRGLVA